MLKDEEGYELTREETLRLHREMWTDMQKELGDNPNPSKRETYKQNWLERHGYKNVYCDCFLCEYAWQAWLANYRTHKTCNYCPIDWSFLTRGPLVDRCYGRYRNGDGEVYKCAPISGILALPERSVPNG